MSETSVALDAGKVNRVCPAFDLEAGFSVQLRQCDLQARPEMLERKNGIFNLALGNLKSRRWIPIAIGRESKGVQ